MGTTWSLAYADTSARAAELTSIVQTTLDEVVAQMSPWEPRSVLARFNAAPSGAWIAAPPDFLTVLDAALEAARLTNGAYDPTCGALTELWGFGPPVQARLPPRDDDLAASRAACGWRKLSVEGGRMRQPGGLKLDLNACAKGFGVDKAAGAVEALGVQSYLLEVGGELRGAGLKPNRQPWWVEVEAPPDAREDGRMLVALTDMAIATSADHRRRFISEGRAYGHTLDMATGAPRAPGGAASATVLHHSCLWADLLATCALVLAPGDALDLLDKQQAAGSLHWRDQRLHSDAYVRMLS